VGTTLLPEISRYPSPTFYRLNASAMPAASHISIPEMSTDYQTMEPHSSLNPKLVMSMMISRESLIITPTSWIVLMERK
jgi:hypothetical protein